MVPALGLALALALTLALTLALALALTLALTLALALALALAHYGTKPGHFETSKIHCPTSEGVSKVSERANK